MILFALGGCYSVENILFCVFLQSMMNIDLVTVVWVVIVMVVVLLINF